MSAPAAADIRHALHRYGIERDRLRGALAQATGLTPTDLDALEYLEAKGPQTQRELGDRLLLTSGGVTVLVDRLEAGGWVRRTKHPTDRRAVLVELSPSVPAAQLDAMERYHAAIEAAARKLSADERRSLGRFLDAVAARAAHTTEQLRGRTT